MLQDRRYGCTVAYVTLYDGDGNALIGKGC
jgi:hypothetical protein